jgi:predicted transcriptional regulator
MPTSRTVGAADALWAQQNQAGVIFDPETLAKLDSCARKKGLSRSWVLNLAVTESLEQWERQERGRVEVMR